MKAFPKVIVDVKKTKCDPYSKIKYPCLDIKTFNNINQKRKVGVFLSLHFLRLQHFSRISIGNMFFISLFAD